MCDPGRFRDGYAAGELGDVTVAGDESAPFGRVSPKRCHASRNAPSSASASAPAGQAGTR